MSETIIICIYCKKLKPRPSRGEHVVLAGLDGTTCIPDVCHDCNNNVLAPLDQEFLRNSPIALHRLFAAGTRGELQEPQFLPHEPVGGFVDCTIKTGPVGVTVPIQLFLLNGKLTSISPLDGRDQLREACEYLERAESVSTIVRRAVRDIPEHVPARLVARSKNSKWRFVLRAQRDEEADALLVALRDWRRLFDADGRHVESAVDCRVLPTKFSTPVNAIERCVAKMAFNFLALHLGPEFALRPEFDAVRRYINGEGVEPVRSVAAPDGEMGWTVDTRFVTPWHADRKMQRGWWVLPEGHMLALSAYARNIFCLVHLFGGRESFAVSLGRVADDAETKQSLPFFLWANPSDGGHDEFFGIGEMLTRVGDALARAESQPLLCTE